MGLNHSYTRGLLFHYTSRETAIEYIFKNMTIKLAAITGTNDLRETEPWYFGASIEDEELSPNGEEFMNVNKELDRALKSGCKISCFSEDVPDIWSGPDPDKYHRPELKPQGYAHDRMWAQYAGNHSGVCIFFDKEKLIAQMQKHFKERPGHLLHGPVRYVDSTHIADGDPFHVSWDELCRVGVAEYAKIHRIRFAQQIYLTKNPDWRSEQEYRFVWIEDGGAKVEPEYVSVEGCVRAICLGGRFPQVYEVNMKDIKKRLGIDSYKVYYMRGIQIMPALEDPPAPDVPPSPTVQLDKAFGDSGVVSVKVGDQSRGSAVLLQADSKIVVGGGSSIRRPNGTFRSETFVLARLDSSGQLDRGFGNGGIVSDAAQLGSTVRTLAVQHDGKILALSTSLAGQMAQSIVSRFLPDGSPDLTWGRTGLVVSSVGNGFEAYALSVAAGRVVVGGTCRQQNDAGRISFPVAVVRYLEDGSLDESFGRGGVVVTGFYGDVTISRGLAIQKDGKILIGGILGTDPGGPFAITRYLEDGNVDPTFGDRGLKQFVNEVPGGRYLANSIALQSTGRIVMAGMIHGSGVGSEWAVSRCEQDGGIDLSFGENGFARTGVDKDAGWARACSIVIQKNDSFLVGGCTSRGCVVVSYDSDGRIDESFGEKGIGLTGFHMQEGQQMLAACEMGGIVLCGVENVEGANRLAVARIR